MSASAPTQRGRLAFHGRAALILLVAALLFYFTLTTSLAGILRADHPGAALSVYGADAQAKAGMASRLLIDQHNAVEIDRARDLAREALRRDPLNVTAMRTLALISDLKGDHALAWKQLNEAEAMSRRDLLTQLSIIEYLSAAGDISDTLHHYDVAMRASRASREVLIPNLIQAAADPELVQPIARLVAARPPQWWTDFMDGMVGGGSVRSAVAISNAVLKPSNPADRTFILNMIVRTIQANEYDLAWSVYAHAFPADARTTQDGLRDGGFEDGHGVPPFDWQLVEDADFTAERMPTADGKGQYLALRATGGRSGEIAKQLLRLGSGRHRLAAEFGNVPASFLDRPSVALRCVEPGNQVLLELKPDRAGALRLGGDFVVPAGCRSQWLAVFASGQGPLTDAVPWVDNIHIERR